MPSEENVYLQPKIYRRCKNAKKWCEEYFEEHPDEKGYIKNHNNNIIKWYNKNQKGRR